MFDLSHDVKMSLNMGELVPIMCMDCVPGDKINISASSLLRFQPMLAPIMHKVDVTMHYFFVPNRILWDKWEDYITNTKTANVLPAFPYVETADIVNERLADYLGVPPQVGAISEKISAFPFAAYQKIYDEYYRDQNLIAETYTPLVNGDNTANVTALTTLKNRAWTHDYFTSALPFAQKGESVSIPLGDVTLKDDWLADGQLQTFRDGFNGFPLGYAKNEAGPDRLIIEAGGSASTVNLDPNGSLEVTPTTINDLRRAFRLQEWLEKNARGGTRYIENILSHFGVKSSDARLQRPEYITGTKAPVQISEVLNTTGTDDAPQGQMAGHGISVTAGKNGSYRCEEHGYIIGIMSVLPQTAYQQGIPKHFTKITDPTEYYWPSFANIGEQEIKQKEIFAYTANSDDTFGYVPRYAEYKFINNRVAGDMRTSLDYWHMGRQFATAPALNGTFITCDPTHRIFAVTDPTEQKLIAHVYNEIKAIRPMPKFGSPQF